VYSENTSGVSAQSFPKWPGTITELKRTFWIYLRYVLGFLTWKTEASLCATSWGSAESFFHELLRVEWITSPLLSPYQHSVQWKLLNKILQWMRLCRCSKG
jgi:hypothetical protein